MRQPKEPPLSMEAIRPAEATPWQGSKLYLDHWEQHYCRTLNAIGLGATRHVVGSNSKPTGLGQSQKRIEYP
jgi:hypothetical protein